MYYTNRKPYLQHLGQKAAGIYEHVLVFFLPVNLTINAPQGFLICPSWYFNKRLLKVNEYFASDADYTVFGMSVYEQHNLRSSINFAMHKIKPGSLTTGNIKSNLKGKFERFAANDNAFSFVSICELSQRSTSILKTVFI